MAHCSAEVDIAGTASSDCEKSCRRTAEPETVMQQIKAVPYRRGGGVRPKILPRFALTASMKTQLRKILIGGYVYERIRLIIPQGYVVGRSLGLYQILLEQ